MGVNTKKALLKPSKVYEARHLKNVFIPLY